MRRLLVIIVLLLTVESGAGFSLAAPMALAPGDQAPELSGRLHPTGQRYTADWSANKVTVVNFWATWCAPCKTEMPELQKLWERLGEQGLGLVGPLDDSEVGNLPEFFESLAVTYPIVGIQREVDLQWGGIGVMPTSFLVGPSGRILRRYLGYSPEQMEGLAADVEAVIAGRPLGPMRSVTAPPSVAKD